MTIAYIGLGSNMNSPVKQIKSAITSIEEIISTKIIGMSSLYKSKPVGPQNQDDYINAVIKIETKLVPYQLLECLHDIEEKHGRIRKEHWGPRILDLDILIFGNEIMVDEKLTIPHPEIENRSFVLAPLIEIDPDCIIPKKGLASDLLATIGKDNIVQIQ
ncbi:MAG: 2-amino-4-hydroxy-6-hydroxymethyldihydropteridine diphosphokinase [Legionellales bacterium]|nr:2-amino-4-hydroxy-6-hydroxymethyldihydropteridine diphosphokinase [Legionellales bacterium]